MIAEHSNKVFAFSGRDLLDLVESDKLALYPAIYRLVFKRD